MKLQMKTDRPGGLEKSRISPRRWVRSAAMFGTALFVSASLLVPNMASAQDPQYGGTMTVVTSKPPVNYDPYSNTSSTILQIVGPIYNALIMFDPENPTSVIGDLATSWDLSADGLTYTFHITDKAVFNDGVPLTSADVKASFDFMRDPPEGAVSSRASVLAAIDDISTPDDYTVDFNLKRKSPALIASLAAGWFVVAPKHILDRDGDLKENTVGSGPFMVAENIAGVSIKLVRNPNYWVEGRPYLDAIEYFIVPDPGTRYAAMRTGQADFYSGVKGRDARQAATELADTVNVLGVTGMTGDPYITNSLREPFGDIRVRKALALSIDREEAVQVVNAGDGVMAGLILPEPWGLSASEIAKIPGYGPDVEADRAEAKRLLAEAGYPDGFDTTIIGRRNVGTHSERMVFLADQFGKIGVRVKTNPMESATYFEEYRKRNFDIATNVVSVGSNDPDSYFGPYHTCEGSQNWSGVCNPEVDALFIAQSQETDPAKRLALTHEMEKLALQMYGIDVLYFKLKFKLASKRLHNYVIHPEGDNNLRYQNVWLSDK